VAYHRASLPSLEATVAGLVKCDAAIASRGTAARARDAVVKNLFRSKGVIRKDIVSQLSCDAQDEASGGRERGLNGSLWQEMSRFE
jgi:hypothetical protein